MESPFSIAGKNILVTGATSGIGMASAMRFASAGAKITATGRSVEKLDALKAEISGEGHTFVSADLNDESDFQKLAEISPALDGVFHCAGLGLRVPLKFISDEQIMSSLNANYLSAVKLTRALLISRKINKGASLLYVASVAASSASPGHFAYAAAKSALVAFAREMALELAPRKIRSNSISPGVVLTPMVDAFFKANPELMAIDEKKYLLGYGSTEDVANAAQFFLSDASKWVSGTNFVIDGGFTCQK